MSTVNGFQVGSETLKYNYESLDNYNTPNFSTSSSTAYAVGDYVMYNGKLYKCTTATTGGTWVSGSWTEAVLADDVSDLNRQISDVEESIVQQTNDAIDGTFVLPQNYLEQGSYTSQGIPIDNPVSQVRIRSKYPIYVKSGSSFSFTAGSKCNSIYWFFFKDSGELETSGAWVKTAIKIITESGYLLFAFRRSNDDIIAPSDYDANTIIKTSIANTVPLVNALDIKINTLHNEINYNYDVVYDLPPDPTATTASAVGIKREKNIFTINTINEPSVLTKIKISGNIMRTTSSTIVDAWEGIALISAHKYRIKAIPISGGSTANTPNAISVYEQGTHATIGNSWKENNIYYRDFIYENIPVNIVYVIANNASYNNYKCLVTLTDITDQEKTGDNIVDDYDASISTNGQGTNDGVKLKVVSYNVAAYNNDTSVYLPTDKEINFKKMLCEIVPDILAIQEDKQYVTGTSGRLALTSLYNPIFPYEYLEQSRLTCSVRSKTPALTHDLLKYSNGRWIEYATYEINGKILLFGSTHPVANYNSTGVDSAESVAARLVQFQELVDWLNGSITLKKISDNSDMSCPQYDWCVMCGDFNTITEDDKTNLKTIATNGNFKLANGDWLGWIETNYKFDYPLCLDNVMVSENVIFNSIISHSDMYQSLYSDHVPFEVTVTLQDIV